MTLYGVSVGTGDPEDITAKALRTIGACRVIAVPVTRGGKTAALDIAAAAADLSGKEILRLEMPMSHDAAVVSEAHRAAADALCEVLAREDAAMLCLGDVALYSTFSYVAALVRERGFDVRCVSGVCSPCAAANAAGIPLALGNEPLLILPFGAEGFQELINMPCRKAVMKSGRGREVKEALRGCGLLGSAYAAENCGMKDERVSQGEDIPDDSGYFTVYIVNFLEN